MGVLYYLKENKTLRYQVISLLLLTTALPVLLVVATLQTKIATKAAPGPVVLQVWPLSQSTSIGGKGTFSVVIHPKGISVSAVEIVLAYDPQVIDVNEVVPGKFFTTDASGKSIIPQEIIKNISSGKIHYALGFPLGSKLSKNTASTADIADNYVASFTYTRKTSAKSFVNIVVSGRPYTIIASNAGNDVFNQTDNPGVLDIVSTSTPTITPINTPSVTITASLTPVSASVSPTAAFSLSGGSTTIFVSSSSDDAFAYAATVNSSSEYINIPSWARGYFRFILSIPKGSTINSAYINMRTYGSFAGSALAHFKLVNNANCANFQTNPFNLTTTGDVVWDTGTIPGNTWTKTRDLSALVQEFINRVDYLPGNAICIVWQPDKTSSDRAVWAYDAVGSKIGDYAPKLEINYK